VRNFVIPANAGIQCSCVNAFWVPAFREDGGTSSFPRMRESSAFALDALWVPAFARTTVKACRESSAIVTLDRNLKLA
jgi:hypothetical protein